MVTYLVVLLQFQISIPEESQEQFDVTSNLTEPVTEATTALTTLTSMLTTIAKKKKKH